MTGIELITAERQRQIEVEGWTAQHDDRYVGNQLILAANCYLLHETGFLNYDAAEIPTLWPWHPGWWKPNDDPIRNLTKAAALIVAEIDRLQRLQ